MRRRGIPVPVFTGMTYCAGMTGGAGRGARAGEQGSREAESGRGGWRGDWKAQISPEEGAERRRDIYMDGQDGVGGGKENPVNI